MVATDEEEFKEKFKNAKENEKEVANGKVENGGEEEEIVVIGQKKGIVVDRRRMPTGCLGWAKIKINP